LTVESVPVYFRRTSGDHPTWPPEVRHGTRRQWLRLLSSFSLRRIAIAELRVNGYIRAREVRVVAPDGAQIGIKKLQEALWLADQLGLDLVEVAPNSNPPVCRLMDYGKYKYEQSVKSREARRNQSRTVIKEVKFKPKIGQHDYEIKRDRVLKFLEHGDKVKITIWFRGREMSRPELGLTIIDKLVGEIGDAAKVEQTPRQEGRNMHMVLAPGRRAVHQTESKPESDEDEAILADEDEAIVAAESVPEPGESDEERSS